MSPAAMATITAQDWIDPVDASLADAEAPVPAVGRVCALAAVMQDLLLTIKCPVRVMASREDHVVKPANAPLIARGVSPHPTHRCPLNAAWGRAPL